MKLKNLPPWLVQRGDMDDDGDGDVELILAEPIGYDPETYDGISSRHFGAVLASIPKKTRVHLMINCLGGRVDEGTAMYNQIQARGNVYTHVIGYAASMGAVVHQAGEHRTMMPGTMLIIHNPQGGADGEEKDLQAAANALRVVKGNIVDVLASRTGMKKQELSDMMDAVTAMGPKEAKKNGFIDEIKEGSPITNEIQPQDIFNICRRFQSVRMDATEGGRSTAIQPQKKENRMSKLTETLARLKLIPSAELAEDAAVVMVENSVGGLIAQRDQLQATNAALTTENAAAKDAQKTRVTNRVQKAIDDKKIKPERKDALIALGITNEANLDFLDDLAVESGTARRGSAALPPAKSNEGKTNEERLTEIRDQMAKEKDPIKIGQLALECRKLRGQENLFAVEPALTGVTIGGKTMLVPSK